ncbi:MAG: T9SS type A sorting domain-containing protein [Bacteroidota bacterium]|nr:T9SS type A sorting domain-containing protein [Bacteroidota bacterium]
MKRLYFIFILFFNIIINISAQNWQIVYDSTSNFENNKSMCNMSINQNGTAFIAFGDGQNNHKTNVLSFSGLTSWNSLSLSGINNGTHYYQSLAFNSNGLPFIAYSDLDNSGIINVLSLNGTNWVKIGNTSLSGYSINAFTPSSADPQLSLFISPINEPFLVFRNRFSLISVLKYIGSTWNFVSNNSGLGSNFTQNPKLTFNSSNVPFLCYNNSYKLTIQSFTGSNWNTFLSSSGVVTVNGTVLYASDFVNFEFSSSNNPIIAYRDAGNAYRTAVISFNGINWNVLGNSGLSTNKTDYQSLTINKNRNVPFLAYRDNLTTKVSVFSFSGIGWQQIGLLNDSCDFNTIQLKINPITNEPWLLYYKNSKLKIKKFSQKISQTISLNSISTQILTSNNLVIPINATCSSGLPISYTIESNPKGIVTVSANNLLINGIGMISLTGIQQGNSMYLSSSQVFTTFQVIGGSKYIAIHKMNTITTTGSYVQLSSINSLQNTFFINDYVNNKTLIYEFDNAGNFNFKKSVGNLGSGFSDYCSPKISIIDNNRLIIPMSCTSYLKSYSITGYDLNMPNAIQSSGGYPYMQSIAKYKSGLIYANSQYTSTSNQSYRSLLVFSISGNAINHQRTLTIGGFGNIGNSSNNDLNSIQIYNDLLFTCESNFRIRIFSIVGNNLNYISTKTLGGININVNNIFIDANNYIYASLGYGGIGILTLTGNQLNEIVRYDYTNYGISSSFVFKKDNFLFSLNNSNTVDIFSICTNSGVSYPSITNSSNDFLVCLNSLGGTNIQLGVTASGINVFYTWQNKYNNEFLFGQNVITTTLGTYVCTVTNTCGYKTSSNEIKIQSPSKINYSFEPSLNYYQCIGEKLNLTFVGVNDNAPNFLSPSLNYIWSNGLIGNSITVTSTSSITSTISGQCETLIKGPYNIRFSNCNFTKFELQPGSIPLVNELQGSNNNVTCTSFNFPYFCWAHVNNGIDITNAITSSGVGNIISGITRTPTTGNNNLNNIIEFQNSSLLYNANYEKGGKISSINVSTIFGIYNLAYTGSYGVTTGQGTTNTKSDYLGNTYVALTYYGIFTFNGIAYDGSPSSWSNGCDNTNGYGGGLLIAKYNKDKSLIFGKSVSIPTDNAWVYLPNPACLRTCTRCSSKTYLSSALIGYEVDATGNIFLIWNVPSFFNVPIGTSGKRKIILQKLDNTGNNINSVEVGNYNSGNNVGVGAFAFIDSQNKIHVFSNAGLTNYKEIIYSSDLIKLTESSTDFENIQALKSDKDDNVYIASSFKTNKCFGSVCLTPSSLTYPDVAIVKIKGGTYYWVKQIGDIYNEDVNEIFIDERQNVFIEGTFTTQTKFEDISITGNTSGTTEFLAKLVDRKLYPAETEVAAITSIYSIESHKNILIYPNPTTGTFTIESSVSLHDNIIIYNIHCTAIQNLQAKGEKSIQINGLPAGLYLVQIGSFKRKILVE